jgi:hypothetical protein
MTPAKKPEPAVPAKAARRPSASRRRAPLEASPAPAVAVTKAVKRAKVAAAPPAQPVTPAKALAVAKGRKAGGVGKGSAKRGGTQALKLPAPSAETTVKRATADTSTAPVAKAAGRNVPRKKGR